MNTCPDNSIKNFFVIITTFLVELLIAYDANVNHAADEGQTPLYLACKNGNKAILMADGWGNSTKLKERISTDYISSNWELEYCSTGEEPEESTWVVESFNNLIDFLNNNNGDDFKNGIANYTDIDRAMDLMLYTLALNGLDNLSKNILFRFLGLQYSLNDNRIWQSFQAYAYCLLNTNSPLKLNIYRFRI